MVFKVLVILTLLLSATACKQTGTVAIQPESEVNFAESCILTPEMEGETQGGGDPSYYHSRESNSWRKWDDQLKRLYAARKATREKKRLPKKPMFENKIQDTAWESIKASEQCAFAYLIREEAQNDITHCKQALKIAEKEEEVSKKTYLEAIKDLTSAQNNLAQVVSEGDIEMNLRILELFAENLPKPYGNELLASTEIIRNKIK